MLGHHRGDDMNRTLMNRLVGVAMVLALAVPGALVLANGGSGAGPVVSPGVRLVASAPPVADLVLNPPTGVAPVALTADGSGSTDDIGVMSYAFDWGDGVCLERCVVRAVEVAQPGHGVGVDRLGRSRRL